MKAPLLTAIILSVGILSCEDCDDSPATVNPNQDIVATFKLTGYIVPEAVDIDQNGQSSSNLIHESDCYHPSFLTFNSDGTYRLRHNQLVVAGSETDCHSRTTTGNWTRNGNVIIATPHSGQPMQFTFSQEDQTMSRILPQADYPRIDHETGDPETAQGDVTTVFTID
ncbi:lipocalin family protein [Flavobacterium sp. MAH-1]|uniref:Lipocalin family protein n=1 Tax=Flavobacterium agri TaxID=2743471 RepID=A0A7Y9C4K5_9FLAO|nr:lipocalin family protein [Flavobacterium agri]NUY80266.1 lipocalin family protein [Flavobacterium agri]NYA70291.1 lipocalin family protein [Flavobacterium agri]